MSGVPSVYTIPAGTPFVDALAAGILGRRGDDPAELARFTVLLPTRRACRSLRDAFLRQGGGAPMLLPRMAPIGEVDEDELLLAGAAGNGPAEGAIAFDLEPAISGLRRQLLLTRLVMAGRDTSPDQAAGLALELGRLLDQAHTERVGFDNLAALVPDDFAAHWQVTLEFLTILTEQWPKILQDEGVIDHADHRNRLLKAQADAWEKSPPSGPVIAAGSTGSIPATADLLKTVAGLKQGTLVLPGLDFDTADDAWCELGPHHPQYGMARLIEHLGVARNDVEIWPAPGVEARSQDRARLINAALVPAAAQVLEPVDAGAGLNGLVRIDCPGPQEEALAIALIMRQTLEQPDRTAALVTPDRSLARRVTAELRRWSVEIDDSAGLPMAQTPPGAFLRLSARMVTETFAPVPLLAALKHPLASCGMATAQFRGQVRELEKAILRGPRPEAGLDGLARSLKKDQCGLKDMLAALRQAVDELATLFDQGDAGLDVIVAAHIRMAESLAAADDETGAERLWAGEAGEAVAGFIAELMDAAPVLGPVAPWAYPELLDSLLAARPVRPRHGRHPRLNIWGLLEARLQHADVMILGGLNEGTWPPETTTGPWMSRPMLKDFGLPLPERRIGLTAHDFTQCASACQVVMTRASRIDGTPTVPSRWLRRLDNLLERLGQSNALAPPEPWLDWAARLDEPEESRRVSPPRPMPPVEARPRELSVTRIETWIRDPYAIYAGNILKLRSLDPIDADPGAAERGSIIHDVLDQFIKAYPNALPDDAERRLLEIGRGVFDAHLSRPGVRAFWWPRFERIAEWFVAYERARRDAGFQTAAAEIKGRMEIAGLAGPFALTARADRIDHRADIGLMIMDYKTGQAPTAKQVAAGLAPQLPLEAAMAEAGRFADLEAGEVAALVYLRLSGGRVAGEERILKLDVAETVEKAVLGLGRLVHKFDDAKTPYLSQPRPMFLNIYGDYDHLARVGEWRVGGGKRS
jgi:ATP-dependent helicase/nuclease subunit B